MAQQDLQPESAVEWLKFMLALLTIAFLVVLYYVFWLGSHTLWRSLLLAIIPNAIIGLVAVVVVYFLFYRRGLTSSQLRETHRLDAEALAAEVVTKLGQLPPNNSMGTYKPRQSQTGTTFFETFRYVDWPSLLRQSDTRLDIVVYYFDSWVTAHYEHLVGFYRRPGTSVRIFVSDPTVPENLKTVQRLFPEYSEAEVSAKVTRTGERMKQALQEAGGAPSRLEFYYFPYVLNYSAQCLDGKTLVLSFFEMFRQKMIDSPAVVIDLAQSDHMAQYWQKELEGLSSQSHKVSV